MQYTVASDFSSLIQYLHVNAHDQLFVLVDQNTRRDCLPLISGIIPHAKIIEIEAGEHNKNLDSCTLIWKKLVDENASRHTLFINLGGGVITDMGGFAASTYKRGLRFINIPTSLLAMVDAAIGGKTGIDFGNLKNMIGTFQLAEHTFIFPLFLKTLAPKEIRSGYAEMIKHGMIANQKHLDELLNFDFKTESISNALIEKSIAIKTSIVAQDPTEKGLRKTLNFGHTIGHALESYFMQSDKARLLHGEAVALGMIAELYLSVLKNNFRKESFEYLSRQIQQIYADIKLPLLDIDELLAFMYNDKKNKDAQISFCLLQEIGKANFDNACTEVEIRQAINKLYEVIQ